ncbi:MAG: carbon storage regulator [Candidatus Tyrphobacter sp.]
MLCLNRKVRESIYIGDDIRIVVIEIKHNVVKLGIEAPQGVSVLRSELREGERVANAIILGEIPSGSVERSERT